MNYMVPKLDQQLRFLIRTRSAFERLSTGAQEQHLILFERSHPPLVRRLPYCLDSIFGSVVETVARMNRNPVSNVLKYLVYCRFQKGY